MRLAISLMLCVTLAGLSVYSWSHYKDAREGLRAERAMKVKLANEVEIFQERMAEEEDYRALLENRLQTRSETLQLASNRAYRAEAQLRLTEAELGEARTHLQTAQAEIKAQQAEIDDLVAERGDLTTDLAALNSTLQSLNKQILETQSQLNQATGDREFLLGELKRLREEKEEVLRQFNDLDALRIQVAKLRKDAVISRRLDWMKRGIYSRRNLKGAELLVIKESPMFSGADSRLQVEFHEDEGPDILSPPSPTKKEP